MGHVFNYAPCEQIRQAWEHIVDTRIKSFIFFSFNFHMPYYLFQPHLCTMMFHILLVLFSFVAALMSLCTNHFFYFTLVL